jgi:hypothetical protein
LVRQPDESLNDMLQRLEAAYEYDHFTDEIKSPINCFPFSICIKTVLVGGLVASQ